MIPQSNEGVHPVSPASPVQWSGLALQGSSSTRQESQDQTVQQCLYSAGGRIRVRRCQIPTLFQPLAQKWRFWKDHLPPSMQDISDLELVHVFTNFSNAHDRTGACPFHRIYLNETPKSAFSALQLAVCIDSPFLSRTCNISGLHLLTLGEGCYHSRHHLTILWGKEASCSKN